jgi:hypothetical protein
MRQLTKSQQAKKYANVTKERRRVWYMHNGEKAKRKSQYADALAFAKAYPTPKLLRGTRIRLRTEVQIANGSLSPRLAMKYGLWNAEHGCPNMAWINLRAQSTVAKADTDA